MAASRADRSASRSGPLPVGSGVMAGARRGPRPPGGAVGTFVRGVRGVVVDIDRNGIHQVMGEALANVTEGTDMVHVSFDLDSVDPSLAPGVGTPVKGGLDYREAQFIMEFLSESGAMTSLELVEVNPILDDRNRSAEFLEHLRATHRPMVLTVNGRAAAVIQDAEGYQRLLDLAAAADAAEGIRQGLDDVANGRVRAASEVFDELRAEFGIPR